MNKNIRLLVFLIASIMILISAGSVYLLLERRIDFDGEKALEDVIYQESLGPRIPGSEAHTQIQKWMTDALVEAGWSVEKQQCLDCKMPVTNLIARKGSGENWIILGAHYDTRILADKDPDPAKRNQPVPGANDGGSGVAVLLEIARVLPIIQGKQIWLVFFDAEDNGGINGYDWLYGSRYFVEQTIKNMDKDQYPDAAIIVDMIGDRNLNIYYEMNSNKVLSEEIWAEAQKSGFEQFIMSPKYRMLDDHTPFLEAGIPAVDIIDFDYQPWHTTNDSSDKVASASLDAVGTTLISWLMKPVASK